MKWDEPLVSTKLIEKRERRLTQLLEETGPGFIIDVFFDYDDWLFLGDNAPVKYKIRKENLHEVS